MIITIEDNIDDATALALVAEVVKIGKISTDTKDNKFYCWATIITHNGVEYAVYTRRNINQPSFIVTKSKMNINK